MYLQVKSFSLISVHVKSLSLLSKVCTGIGPKFYNEHSGGCRRQPSTPAEGGRRAKLVCRYRVYHLSEAIKLKTQRPPTGFLVLQTHHSHTCKIWGTSAFCLTGIFRLVYISIFPCCFLHAIIRVTTSKVSYFLIFRIFLYLNFFYMYHLDLGKILCL